MVMTSYNAHPPLDQAEAEGAAIAALFAGLGGTTVPWDVAADERLLPRVTARLREWSSADSGRNSVLFWLGHGYSNDDNAVLFVRGVVPADDELVPAILADMIRERRSWAAPDGWTMVVIEACGAYRFVDLVLMELIRLRAHSGVLLIGIGTDMGRGYLPAFRRALEAVCNTYYDKDTVITLADLGGRIEKTLPEKTRIVYPIGLANVRPIRRQPGLLASVTAPFDVHAELQAILAALPPHEREHFAHKGTGSELGEFGWYFAGREREREQVLDWLSTHSHGILAITGAAGCGKSAILGNILLHANPGVREVLSRTGRTDGEWQYASRLPRIHASILLTGLTVRELVDQLAALVQLSFAPDTALESKTEDLAAALAEVPEGLTLVLDSLDEAADPDEAAALIRLLARTARARIVIGTRPSLRGQPADESLLDALRWDGADVTVNWLKRDPDALAEYVTRRLSGEEDLRVAVGPGYSDLVDDVADLIVKDLPTLENPREFLHARLAVRELIAEPELLMAERRPDLLALLGMSHQDLFARAVARMTELEPVCEVFLESLALAGGRGLPRADDVWLIATQALSHDAALGDADLNKIIDLAGPYIMLDAAEGQSVFRLAHRSFNEHFTARPGTDAKHLLLTVALIDAVMEDRPVNPYVRRHLSSHAAAAGPAGWDVLAAHPQVLDRLDIRSIVADVMDAEAIRPLPSQVVGAFLTAHLASLGRTADRAGLRQLGLARLSGRLDEEGAETRPAVPWRLRWARVRPQPPHVTIMGHKRPVSGLARLRGVDGSQLLASVGEDGVVKLWDLGEARPVRCAIPTQPTPYSAVTALATLLSDGPDHLVTADIDGSIQVWAPDGAALATYKDDAVRTVAVLAGPNGSTRLAFAGDHGTIKLWDPAVGAGLARRPLTAHAGAISTVVTVDAIGGAQLLASGGTDKKVRLWDSATSRKFTSKQVAGPITALTTLRRGWEETVVAVGDRNGLISLVDLQARPVEPLVLRSSSSPVAALTAVPRGDASDALAVGAEDGSVKIIDPHSAAHHDIVLTGHEGPVRCMTWYTDRRDNVRLATGGADGTVRIWELPSGPFEAKLDLETHITALQVVNSPDGLVLTGWTADGRALGWDFGTGRPYERPDVVAVASRPASTSEFTAADGTILAVTVLPNGSIQCRRNSPEGVFTIDPLGLHGPPRAIVVARRLNELVLVVAHHDGVIRMWSATDGHSVGTPLTGHSGWVDAMAVTTDDEHDLVVSAGEDGRLVVWDLTTTTPLYVVPLGTRIHALACVGASVAVASDDGLLLLRLYPDHLRSEEDGS